MVFWMPYKLNLLWQIKSKKIRKARRVLKESRLAWRRRKYMVSPLIPREYCGMKVAFVFLLSLSLLLVLSERLAD